MDILVKKSTSEEIQRWDYNPGKVQIPGSTDVVFCGTARPIDVGPDHFLATATIVEPPLGPNQKRGPETKDIDVASRTATVNRPAVDMTQDEINAKGRMVSFDDFEARFQPSEWDLATDFVYEANTTTGKPKRRVLVQGLARAQARNRVDLLDAKTDAFLSALVAGEVITAPRKAEILEP